MTATCPGKNFPEVYSSRKTESLHSLPGGQVFLCLLINKYLDLYAMVAFRFKGNNNGNCAPLGCWDTFWWSHAAWLDSRHINWKVWCFLPDYWAALLPISLGCFILISTNLFYVLLTDAVWNCFWLSARFSFVQQTSFDVPFGFGLNLDWLGWTTKPVILSDLRIPFRFVSAFHVLSWLAMRLCVSLPKKWNRFWSFSLLLVLMLLINFLSTSLSVTYVLVSEYVFFMYWLSVFVFDVDPLLLQHGCFWPSPCLVLSV